MGKSLSSPGLSLAPSLPLLWPHHSPHSLPSWSDLPTPLASALLPHGPPTPDCPPNNVRNRRCGHCYKCPYKSHLPFSLLPQGQVRSPQQADGGGEQAG